VEEFKSVADSNAVFQQKIIEELERVRATGGVIKKELNSLSGAIAQGKTRLDENNQTIQQQKVRLDQSIAEFQKQFSEAQEKRTKDFADSLKKNSDEFTTQEKRHETEFKDTAAKRKIEYEAFFEDARKQSNAHLDFLQKREAEVNKIFGAIGTTAFAGNFKTTADTEASSANLWRWIALSLMAAMIVVGGYAFYYSIGHETDWRVFAFRLGTVIVLAIPAIYAANESSKHRERERQNRKTHLELASLDAYLVLLPEAERNKIKGNLTDKFFGVPVLKEKADEVTQKDLFGVLTTVLNNLTKGK
jgi:rubrerythrin